MRETSPAGAAAPLIIGVSIAAMSRVSSRPMAGAALQPRLPAAALQPRLPAADTSRTVSQAIGAITTILTIDLNAVRRRHAVLRRPEDSELAVNVRDRIEAGERPTIQVAVVGFDGLHVHLFVQGVSGAVAHTRTRRRARALARSAAASMLRVDPYAFDLEVDGA